MAMRDDWKSDAVYISGILFLVSLLVVPFVLTLMAMDRSTERFANLCIKQGNEYIDGSCIHRENNP